MEGTQPLVQVLVLIQNLLHLFNNLKEKDPSDCTSAPIIQPNKTDEMLLGTSVCRTLLYLL